MAEQKIKKGIESLRLNVQRHCNENGDQCFNPSGCNKIRVKCSNSYCNKYKWILERAEEYAKALSSTKEEVLKVWEEDRTYCYTNYYQEYKQPRIANTSVYIYDNIEEFLEKTKGKYRCSSCEKITVNAYECTQAGCNFKSYGLMGTLGKGVTIIFKDSLRMTHIFKPIVFEKEELKESELYCVVATERDSPRKRIMLTKGVSKERAHCDNSNMQGDSNYRLLYKYFKIAKYPYNPKK